ncbi:MAG TPA: hypothetical protein PLT70_06490 [bacterium]|nr:hypothetical protein [bacterium]HPM48144.1 hypothetical protein [bacterium]HQN72993.1 hypothetical protein [bacterium]
MSKQNTVYIISIFTVFILFVILKMFSLNPYAGDEHIYIYQAKLVSEGFLPYKDFSLAHPPFHTIITAIIIKSVGYGFYTTRFFPFLWTIISGTLLTLLTKNELGKAASVAGLAIFLFSYDLLRVSSHSTGVNCAVALTLAGILFLRKKCSVPAAIFFSLALMTRFYVFPVISAALIYSLFSDRSGTFRTIKFLVFFLFSSFLFLGLFCGFENLWTNFFMFHFNKTSMSGETLSAVTDKFMFHNFTLISLFILSIPLYFIKMDKAKSLILLSIICAASMFALLFSMNRVWSYYFIPALPFAAIAGGWVVSEWIESIRNKRNIAVTAVTVLIFIVVSVLSFKLESRLDYWDKEMAKPLENRTHFYKWRDGFLPGFLNTAVNYTLWNEKRVIGNRYFFFNYYLWHESRVLEIAEEAVEIIIKNTSENGEISGDSGTVPLFALLSGKRIAGNDPDTNIQKYRSGVFKASDLIFDIDTPKTEMIILRKKFGIAGLSEIKELVARKYNLINELKDPSGITLLFYKRKN